MGRALEIVTGRVVNPGAALTSLTPNTGDSFSVKNFNLAAGAQMEDIWAQGAAAQTVEVRSAKLHDNLHGIRLITPAGVTRSLLSEQFTQRIYPSDVLTVQSTGGAAETDDVALLMYYEDLPGADARLTTWEEIAPRVASLVSVECDITLGGTAGDYQGSRGIDVQNGVLKARTDYAILGYLVTTQVLAVGIRSPDFGNLRVGGPGATEAIETRDWFVDLSRRYARPHVPVFNADNKGATLVDLASVAVAGTVLLVLHLAELA